MERREFLSALAGLLSMPSLLYLEDDFVFPRDAKYDGVLDECTISVHCENLHKEWRHIVVTSYKGNIRTYVDGICCVPKDEWTGRLDEITIFDRILSVNEIETLWGPDTVPGLVHWEKLG